VNMTADAALAVLLRITGMVKTALQAFILAQQPFWRPSWSITGAPSRFCCVAMRNCSVVRSTQYAVTKLVDMYGVLETRRNLV
jgi:hypothetical protein